MNYNLYFNKREGGLGKLECKKCGAVIADESTFCSSCGSRVDGKKICNKCQNLNNEANTFCSFCGERLDGKQECSVCGSVYEGNYCSHCGQTNEKTFEDKTERKKSFPGFTCEKVFEIAANCIAMLGVLMALIFVFFIEIKIPETEELLFGSALGSNPNRINIFYYFGKYYKNTYFDFDEYGLTKWLENYFATNYLWNGVIKSFISVGTIVFVVLFSILAIVRFSKNILGITDKKADKYAISAIFSFLVGTTLFYMMHKTSIDASILIDIKGAMVISNTTKAGIIVSVLCLGLFAIFKIVAKEKEFSNKQKIFGFVCSIIGITFALAVYLLAKDISTVIELSEEGYSALINLDFFTDNSFLGLMVTDMIGEDVYYKATEYLSVAMISNVFTVIGILGVIISVAGTIRLLFSGIWKQERINLDCVIFLNLFAIVTLISNIIAWEATQQVFVICREGFEVETSFTIPICVVVFSVLCLILGIVKNATSIAFVQEKKEETN